MLEPYVDHPSVRDKIILVSSGFKAPEIDALSFDTAMWPKVFTPTRAPKQVLAKLERAARERQSLARLSLDKTSNTRAQPLALAPGSEMLMDLLRPWNVRNATARYIGLGTLQFDDLKRVDQKLSNGPCATSPAEQELD